MGKPLLFHVIQRVKESNFCKEIIIATTKRKSDDKVEILSKELGHKVYRGSTDSVLSRYYHASKRFGADVIVRITADDPFKEPYIIDRLVKTLLEYDYDYVCNNMPPSYPEGLDTEVFTFEALKKCYSEATSSYQLEHVTPYMRENPNLFSIFNISAKNDFSEMRWTIDTQEDLLFARRIYEYLYPIKNVFTMNQILELLEKFPKLKESMPTIERDAGLKLSIENEKDF